MDTYKLKFTRLQNEIFRLLCIRCGERLNQRAIARLLSVSPTAIGKALPLLEKEGLVRRKKDATMNLTTVELNRDNPLAIALKRAENFRMISESGLDSCLEEMFPGCAIILFGSYSFGEDITRSDIDIAIIGPGEEGEEDLSTFEKMLERPINLQFYGRWGEISGNLRSNLMRGITLSGFVEWSLSRPSRNSRKQESS